MAAGRSAGSSPTDDSSDEPRRARSASKTRSKKTPAKKTRPGTSLPAGEPTIHGRDDLIAAIVERCGALRDRRVTAAPRPLILCAPPGSGTSFLLDHAGSRAAEEGARVYLARPPERAASERDPLGAIEAALRSLGRLETLRSHALHSGRGVLSATAARAAVRVLAGREMRGLQLPREASRVRLERGLGELFAASAQRRPMALFVDQAERLDPVSLGTLVVLARIACAGGSIDPPKGAPIFLLVATSNPDDPILRPLLDGTLADRIDVPVLDDEASAELLAEVGGVPDDAIEELVEAADGSPLHLVHAARALAAGAKPAAVTSLEDAARARVEALEAQPANVLAVLARAGRPLPLEAIFESLRFWRREPSAEKPGAPEEIESACRGLVDAGLATFAPVPGESAMMLPAPAPKRSEGSAREPRGWAVAHEALARAALADITPKNRETLAAAIVLGIERWAARKAEDSVSADEPAEDIESSRSAQAPARKRSVLDSQRVKVVAAYPGEDEHEAKLRAARRQALAPWRAMLAELRADAGPDPKALGARGAFAQRAFTRHDDEAAGRHLEALAAAHDREETLPEGWPAFRVAELLGCVAAAAGRGKDALAHFEVARGELGLEEEGDALPRISREAARIEAARGKLEKARHLIGLARTALDQAGPDASPSERGAVLALSGHVALRRGEREAARRHLRRAITVAEATSDRDLAASCLSDLGQVQWLRGEVGAARRFFERVLRLREELGDIVGHAEALEQNGMFRLAVGEGTSAAGLLRRARKGYESLGLRVQAGRAMHAEALAKRAVSDWGAALLLLERAVRLRGEAGDTVGAAESLAERARLLADVGCHEEARGVLAQARRNDVDPADSPSSAVALYRALARTEEQRGEWRAAATRLGEASRLAEGANEMALLAEVLLELALARLSGHGSRLPAAEKDAAREALERAEEIGSLLGLRRLRGLALLIRAEASGLLGRGGKARLRVDVEEAVAVGLEVADRDLEARARSRFADILEGRGEREEAAAQRGAARAAIAQIATTLPEAMREGFKVFREERAGDESQQIPALAEDSYSGFDSYFPPPADSGETAALEPDDPLLRGPEGSSPELPLPAMAESVARRQAIEAARAAEHAFSSLESERLVSLLEINKALNGELELERLLDMIMDAAINLSGAKRGFIVLWEQGEPKLTRSRNVNRLPVDSAEAALSRGLIREAVETKRTVVTACAREERTGYESTGGLDLKSVVVAPLISRNKVLGAIYLDEPATRGAFQDEDVRMVEAFSEQAALALANARLHDELAGRMEATTRELRRAEEELRRQRSDMQKRYRHGNIIGGAESMQSIYKILERAKDSSFPIIIQGESGTGKELVAKFIHFNGPRREKPFVAENCAALPETLLDSELFGYVKGAFTGAMGDKKGLFELANGGSLFLDEIEEMSPAMQRKLLRVLQEGEVRPIGARSTRRVDVRVICATNRDIGTLLELGEFRRDLYYRLNVIRIQLPPLRERREDIPLLVEHYLEEMGRQTGDQLGVEPEAMRLMCAYPWPGNVRELQNELKRMAALGVKRIMPTDLSAQVQEPQRLVVSQTTSAERGADADGLGAGGDGMVAGGPVMLPDVPLREVERMMIRQALEKCDNNKTKAAKQLGLSRRGLLKKLARYGPKGP